MELKSVCLVIIILISVIRNGRTSVTPKEKPIYKCEQDGTSCTFYDVQLNLTHYEWQPTAYKPEIVTAIWFAGCVIPVATKDICETFPSLRVLHSGGLQLEEVKEDAFHACHELTYLTLGSNQIKKIPQNTFLYTKNLQTLELQDNQIMTLEHNNVFSNVPNLDWIGLGINNLTEFSPELIRNNKNLRYLHLYSNDLSDIDAEQIVDFLPNLKYFYLDDNEISCTRLVQIHNMLKSKGIDIGPSYYAFKLRYYPQETVVGNYTCNPDISWMASTYRKQNSIFLQRFNSIKEKTSNQCESGNKYIEEQISDLTNQLRASDKKMMEELSKVNRRFDELEENIQQLIKITLDSKY